MLPARSEIVVVGRTLPSLHAENFATDINRRIDDRTGAAAGAGEQLAVVDRQTSEPHPLIHFLATAMIRYTWLPTIGRIESLERRPFGVAVISAHLGSGQRSAIQLAIVNN